MVASALIRTSLLPRIVPKDGWRRQSEKSQGVTCGYKGSCRSHHEMPTARGGGSVRGKLTLVVVRDFFGR